MNAWSIATALWRAGICDAPRARQFGRELVQEIEKGELRAAARGRRGRRRRRLRRVRS